MFLFIYLIFVYILLSIFANIGDKPSFYNYVLQLKNWEIHKASLGVKNISA